MARLGISIYPEHSTEEQDIAYIERQVNWVIRGFLPVF